MDKFQSFVILDALECGNFEHFLVKLSDNHIKIKSHQPTKLH